MIVKTDEEFKYTVDIGRPEFSNDKEMDQWISVHEWIKNSDVEMKVNGAFDFVDNCLNERQGYLGGGMKYMFWFKTEADKKLFEQSLIDTFGILTGQIV